MAGLNPTDYGFVLREIEHFFDAFKDLEGSDLHSLGWQGADSATESLERSIKR